jgi:hypothetical protein
MILEPTHTRHRAPRQSGFGLVDTLVALALLAVTLLGACGSVHFALRATRAAAWQARVVDLAADLDEELLQADPAQHIDQRIAAWRARVDLELPAARVIGLDPRQLALDSNAVGWFELRLAWNGAPGQPPHSIRLPLANAVAQ